MEAERQEAHHRQPCKGWQEELGGGGGLECELGSWLASRTILSFRVGED